MSASPYLIRETRLVALGRALARAPDRSLSDQSARRLAYVAAGLVPPSDDDDAEALRRVRLKRAVDARGAIQRTAA